MKAKGKYNPITQEAGGEYEYTASDHRETRKDTAFTGAIILLIVAIFAVVAYYLWKGLAIPGVDAIGTAYDDVQNTATDAVVTGANSATQDATDAKNMHGGYYPVKTLTADDYTSMLDAAGLLGIPVKLGNLITPPTMLEAAAAAGSESADTVNELGLNDAYVDLPWYEKGLVTLGQGIGKVAGVDLIRMGYDQRSNIEASTANGQPAEGKSWLW